MMMSKLGNKDDYHDRNENKINLLTPPPIQRKNFSKYIHNMLSLSPSPSFDESPPPSPKSNRFHEANQSLNNNEYRYMDMEIDVERDNDHVSQNRFLPRNNFRAASIYSSNDEDLSHDDEHFKIARKLLRRRHVSKERHNKKRRSNNVDEITQRNSNARTHEDFPHDRIIELLSQTVSNARLKNKSSNTYNYQDEIDINNVAKESRDTINNNLASSSHLDERFYDSPLIKRRLKFSSKLWNQGPNISPKRAKFNLMRGDIYTNET